MPYEPLPSLFPITLEEAEEEEEVVAPPAMPYVPTSVPTPPPPSVYPPSSSSPPLASPSPPGIPSPLPPSIPPAPAPPSSSSSMAPPVGGGGMEVPPSVEITDGQRLETEQLQDESSMDGVQQTGEQQIGEQQIGEQQSGEQQIGEERIEEQQMVDQQLGEQQTREPQTGEQEMWGIRDGGRVLVSGTTTAPVRRSTRITRGVPPVRYAWAVVVEPAGLDDEEEDEEWTDLDPDVAADPERQTSIVISTTHVILSASFSTTFPLSPNLPSLSFTSHALFHHPPPTISKSARTSHLPSSSFVFQPSSALDAARLPPSIPLLSFFTSASPLNIYFFTTITFSSFQSFTFLTAQGLTLSF
ncbi:unnamed protein product [Closterium sp. NIES-65]|nr:unnamed protein product [Closterium sp. NIES-65]